MGSSASVFRTSMSRVPWTRSLGLSDINLLPLGCREENTLLLLVVKRRRTQKFMAAGKQFGEFLRRYGIERTLAVREHGGFGVSALPFRFRLPECPSKCTSFARLSPAPPQLSASSHHAKAMTIRRFPSILR